MKQILFGLILMAFTNRGFAQSIQPTDVVLVTGKVKKERTFGLADMQKCQVFTLENVNTSSSSKRKDEAKSIKAILVKDLLDGVHYQYDSPRMLNQFYFRFEAADGYAVVYSFNEIYNTETGKHLYIVLEMNDKGFLENDNRILVLTTNDLKGGSRNIKNLTRIVVCNGG